MKNEKKRFSMGKSNQRINLKDTYSTRQQAKKNILIVLKLVLGFFVFGFVIGMIFTFPDFEVRNIRIRGVEYSDYSAAVQNTRDLKGINIFTALYKCRAKNMIIARQTEVDSVRARLSLPDTLIVDVREKKPFVVLKYNKKEYLADKTGFVFHKLKQNEKRKNVPVILSETDVRTAVSIAEFRVSDLQSYKDKADKACADEIKAAENDIINPEKRKQTVSALKDKFEQMKLEKEMSLCNLVLLYNSAKYCSINDISFDRIFVDDCCSLMLYLSKDGPAVDFGPMVLTGEKLDLLARICSEKPEIIKDAKVIYLLNGKKATYKPKKNNS